MGHGSVSRQFVVLAWLLVGSVATLGGESSASEATAQLPNMGPIDDIKMSSPVVSLGEGMVPDINLAHLGGFARTHQGRQNAVVRRRKASARRRKPASGVKYFSYPAKSEVVSQCKKHQSDGKLTLRPYNVAVNCANTYMSETKDFEISLGSGNNPDPNEWTDQKTGLACLKKAKVLADKWIAEVGSNVMKRADEVCSGQSKEELGDIEGSQSADKQKEAKDRGKAHHHNNSGGSRRLLGSMGGSGDVTKFTAQSYDGTKIGTAALGGPPKGYPNCQKLTGVGCPKLRADERVFSCKTVFKGLSVGTLSCTCSPGKGKC